MCTLNIVPGHERLKVGALASVFRTDWAPVARTMIAFFFPRVRTPCGHGAQVIVEGREEQTDGGERNEGPKTNPNQTPKPAGRNSTILQSSLAQ